MAITQTTDVSWVQAAYDAYSRPALRSALVYDGFADTFPVAQAMPGSSVILDITNDIAAATTPLTQNVDPTPTTLGDSQVTVTLDEYGSVVGRPASCRPSRTSRWIPACRMSSAATPLSPSTSSP
jgi:hypothetical protein